MKRRLTRVFFMLGVLLFLFGVGGCNHSLGDLKEPDSLDENKIFPSILQDSHTEKKVFQADEFLQPPELSSNYFGFQVTVEDGCIYLGENLYDRISYVENFTLSFEKWLGNALKHADQGVVETLELLKTQDEYYLIETEGSTAFGKRLAVCEMDGKLYFMRLYENNEVMRIHAAEIWR